MTRVAAIIVSYRSGPHLERCLAALDRQTTKPAQIVVVDNEGILDAARLRCSTGIALKLLRPATNTGFAAGNNLGVRACADHEWIALINPDAIAAADWLERLLDAARKTPGVACFASRMLQDGRRERLDGAGDAYHASGLAWRRGYGAPATGGGYDTPREVFSACAAAALYRRDAFEAVGGFDEDFFCYLEDVDLGFRLRLAGHRFLYVPAAVAYHVGAASTGKNSDFAVYHGHRNLVWTYVKNMPGVLFWIYLPYHVTVNAFTAVWYGLKGRWRVILRAKWDAIRGLPKMWRKRREIQAKRVASAWEIRKIMDKGWPCWRR